LTEGAGVGSGIDAGVVGTTADEADGGGLAGTGLMMSQPPAARRQQTRKTTAELRVMVHLGWADEVRLR
jgi:hypothetical protein